MKKIYYLGQPGNSHGWGIANYNITRALGEFCEVIVDTSSLTKFDAPVFVPITDSNLTPLRKVTAPRVLGYCFTEWPIGDKARTNARQYHTLFCGSRWNVERLAASGIKSQVLHQGIDFARFVVQPPSQRKGFVVFSGGKYEFRKGQDYVVAAMHHFLRVHTDVTLLTAWANQWPQSRETMRNSWLLEDWNDPLKGLPKERVFEIPPMPNEKTPEVYAMAHIGVFPNRCEAGTNLVMCEFMASGRAVIATNATGHEDVFVNAESYEPRSPGPCYGDYLLYGGTYDPAGWYNCSVADIISKLQHAYAHREELIERGLQCRRLVERFSWEDCARKIYEAAFPNEL